MEEFGIARIQPQIDLGIFSLTKIGRALVFWQPTATRPVHGLMGQQNLIGFGQGRAGRFEVGQKMNRPN